ERHPLRRADRGLDDEDVRAGGGDAAQQIRHLREFVGGRRRAAREPVALGGLDRAEIGEIAADARLGGVKAGGPQRLDELALGGRGGALENALQRLAALCLALWIDWHGGRC